MDSNKTKLNLLLVDDEADFRRATTQGLSRRGFNVEEAAGGEEALEKIKKHRPDVILLDQKMPGLSGIETLQRIRENDPTLPVIILTGHGDYHTALAGIRLDITEFMQKPVDIDQLASRIHTLLERGAERPMTEPTIAELMAPPSLYPRVYIDDPLTTVLKAIHEAYTKPVPETSQYGQVRSALVFDRNENFLGIVRFSTLLSLLIPSFLSDSPYASFFTGMFLAQTKVFGRLTISGLVKERVFVDVEAPIMEAIHLLVEHKLINIPVLKDGKLVGILRGRDIIVETARLAGAL
jgi:DNA-binding response OmpR family regulator